MAMASHLAAACSSPTPFCHQRKGQKETLLWRSHLSRLQRKCSKSSRFRKADKPYREFLIPAARLNQSMMRLVPELEVGHFTHPFGDASLWNDYPPGEPEKTWQALRATAEAELL
jgi:hypothetical protein